MNKEKLITSLSVGSKVNYTELHWQSDWNGYEVGFPDVDVVGLYSVPDSDISLYVNVESSEILELWNESEVE